MFKRLAITLFIIFLHKNNFGQSITKKIDSIRARYEIPEMAYAVVTPEKIILEEYLGHHKLGSEFIKDTARRSDYFHLGSNTKAITGLIAAYLVEQHKIKWSTKIFDLFPEWKRQANSSYYPVTLQDLLSHRGRIQPYTSGLEYQELPVFKGNQQKQRQLFAAYLLREKPVILDPDKSYSYSNAGYSIAASMLEKVSGLSWEQMTKSIINNKLHLKLRFGWPNRHSTDEPWGHWMEAGKQVSVPGNTSYNLNLGEPAGDISMTLPDYLKLTQLQLTGLSGTDNFLKANTYEFLHYGLKDYAIGWSNVNKNGLKLSDHSGSAGTYFCYSLFDSLNNKAYIIMMNSGTKKAQEGLFIALNILRSQK